MTAVLQSFLSVKHERRANGPGEKFTLFLCHNSAGRKYQLWRNLARPCTTQPNYSVFPPNLYMTKQDSLTITCYVQRPGNIIPYRG
jgi:hypothetical protein